MGIFGKQCQYLLFENLISVFFLGLWWEPHLKMGFPCLFGLFWKIMPIFSIWKRNFRVFSGIVMGTSFENGISVFFWAFLKNHANIFYLKTWFPFFLGSWWESLENNVNIFYLKTGFPFFWACNGNLWKIMSIFSFWKRDFRYFFLACDGNLWKIISISFIWKRNFRVFFLGLWWEPHLKTGFPCFFGLFWKIMPVVSIWKRDFSFFGFVMGTSGK